MAKELSVLQQQAEAITTEVNKGANTSSRIGGMFRDMLDYNEEKLTELSSYTGVYNLDAQVPLKSGFYTATTARAAVPAEIRKLGLIITYKIDASTSVIEQYQGAALTDLAWEQDISWINIMSTESFKQLDYNTDFTTTVLQVPLKERKIGQVIHYVDNNIPYFYTFIGDNRVDDTYKNKANWLEILVEGEAKTIFTLPGAIKLGGSVGNTDVFSRTGKLKIDRTKGFSFLIKYLSNYTEVDYVSFYDKDGDKIGVIDRALLQDMTEVTLTPDNIPEECEYVDVSTANSRKAYVKGVYPASDVAVDNTLSIQQLVIDVSDNIDAVWLDGRINSDGSFTKSSGQRATDFVDVQDKVLYLNTKLAGIHYCYCYDANETPISVIYKAADSGKDKKIILPDNAKKIRITAFPDESVVAKFKWGKLNLSDKAKKEDLEALKGRVETIEESITNNIAEEELWDDAVKTQQYNTWKKTLTKADYGQWINGQYVENYTHAVFTRDDATSAAVFVLYICPELFGHLKDGSNVEMSALMRCSSNIADSVKLYNFCKSTLKGSVSLNPDTFNIVSTGGILSADMNYKNYPFALYVSVPEGVKEIWFDVAAFVCNVKAANDVEDYNYKKGIVNFATEEYVRQAVQASGASSNSQYNIGLGLQRFYAKVWSKSYGWDDTYKQKTIKVVSFADSIGNSIGEQRFKSLLSSAYPDITFEWMFVHYGGSGAWHMLAKAKEAIMFNPDLVFIGEWETYGKNFADQQTLDTLIMLFKQHTQADIALWAHSLRRESTTLLEANNITDYLSSYTHRIRCAMMSYARKYSCEFMDIQQPVIQKLLLGEMTSDDVFASATDVIHPSQATVTIFMQEMQKHFLPVWGNEAISNNIGNNPQVTRIFSEAIEMPDISHIKVTGTCSWEKVNTDRSGQLLKADEGAIIEFDLNNCCGCEITTFGKYAGSYKTYIDGLPASSVIKDYGTCAISPDAAENNSMAGIFSRIHKIVVVDNILADNESVLPFKIVVTSVDFTGDAASIGYDLYQNTTKVGSGNINQNSVFTYREARILVPSTYGFDNNYRSSEYDTNYPAPSNIEAIEVGDEFNFEVRKGAVDTMSITADNLTHANNLLGLKRGCYKVKLEVVNGSVCFDSYMEY